MLSSHPIIKLGYIFGYGDSLNNVAAYLHIKDKGLDNLTIF